MALMEPPLPPLPAWAPIDRVIPSDPSPLAELRLCMLEARPPPPPIDCRWMPWLRSPCVCTTRPLLMGCDRLTAAPLPPLPPLPPRAKPRLALVLPSLALAPETTSPASPPPPPMDWRLRAAERSAAVLICPLSVAFTAPPPPPPPPLPPTAAERPSEKLLLIAEASAVTSLLTCPAWPPPPPMLCRSAPAEDVPVVLTFRSAMT